MFIFEGPARFGLRVLCFVLHLVMEQNDRFVYAFFIFAFQVLVQSDAGCPGMSDAVDIGMVI